MSSQESYQEFTTRANELTDLRSILQSLTWDQETMMPPLAAAFRARQVATLARLHHARLTDPAVGELVSRLEETELDVWAAAGVREMRRQHDRAVKVPASLVGDLAETTSLAYEVWVKAKQESSFADFVPWLSKLLDLKRQEARCLRTTGTLYDALLDAYEPGMTTSEIDRLFADVQPRLSRLLEKLLSSAQRPDPSVLKGSFPLNRQQAFGKEVLGAMGFEWKAGRLDTSPHPFCSGLTPQDVRITTRYSLDDFTKSFFGMVHEGGHALYEQGLDVHHYGSPACDAVSVGIHESQSRLWENIVARGRPFWTHWFPRLREFFPHPFETLPLEKFLSAVNSVEASYIRVDADEVSYGLHIVLRFELEKQLIDGDLEVPFLEEAWNQRMKAYLGVEPRNSAEGVLQDTHWSQGLIGYFPTYLLGTMYASQFYHQAGWELSGLEEEIASGNLIPLREWLREKIHRKGKTVSAPDLVREVTGEPLNPDYFLNYLSTKFGEIYSLPAAGSAG